MFTGVCRMFKNYSIVGHRKYNSRKNINIEYLISLFRRTSTQSIDTIKRKSDINYFHDMFRRK